MDERIALAAGEGEVLVDEPSRSSRIKVARDELFMSESSYGSGEPGTRPHVHREHADAFYVLDGELAFHVGAELHNMYAGSFVLAPPGLVHWFEIGAHGVRHLNVHAPGSTFARLSRARRDGVPFDASDGDTFGPPADGGRPASDAIVTRPGEGDTVGPSVIKADCAELSLLEFEVRPGDGVGPHFHKAQSDSLYVLGGELEFHVGDDVIRGGVGTYVLAPPGVVHSFRNVGDEPARMLNLHTPGGFAQSRRELEELRSQGIEPDAAFFERHDIFDV